MDNKRRKVLKTILITLLSFIVLVVILLTISILCFTENMAKFTYNCGFYSISSNLYAYEYNKSGDINYIAKACNIDIQNKNNKNYIEHYEEFSANNSFDFYITFLNETNYNNANLSKLVKSSLINEKNYYANQYISSLIACGKKQKAIEVAIADFDLVIKSEINYMKTSNYLFSTIITSGIEIDWLINGNDNATILKLLDYNDRLFDHFKIIKTNESLDTIYFLNYCRQVLRVSNDILKIDSMIDIIDSEYSLRLNENVNSLNQSINDTLEANNE